MKRNWKVAVIEFSKRLIVSWLLILAIQGCQSDLRLQPTESVIVETPFDLLTATVMPPTPTTLPITLPTTILPTMTAIPTGFPIILSPESTELATRMPWIIETPSNLSLLFEARNQNNKRFIYVAKIDGGSHILGMGDLPVGQPWSPDHLKLIVFTLYSTTLFFYPCDVLLNFYHYKKKLR